MVVSGTAMLAQMDVEYQSHDSIIGFRNWRGIQPGIDGR